jgi:hypothetical protein
LNGENRNPALLSLPFDRTIHLTHQQPESSDYQWNVAGGWDALTYKAGLFPSTVPNKSSTTPSKSRKNFKTNNMHLTFLTLLLTLSLVSASLVERGGYSAPPPKPSKCPGPVTLTKTITSTICTTVTHDVTKTTTDYITDTKTITAYKTITDTSTIDITKTITAYQTITAFKTVTDTVLKTTTVDVPKTITAYKTVTLPCTKPPTSSKKPPTSQKGGYKN